jgi:hypothetical protein
VPSAARSRALRDAEAEVAAIIREARWCHEKLYKKDMLLSCVLASEEERAAMAEPIGWWPVLDTDVTMEEHVRVLQARVTKGSRSHCRRRLWRRRPLLQRPSELNDPAIWKEGDGWATVTAEYFWKEADGCSTVTAGRSDLDDRQVDALHSSMFQFPDQFFS